MYETYFDKLQPYFGQEKIQLHHLDTESFVLILKTEKIIKDFESLEDLFDFSNLNEKHEKFCNKNKKVIL